MGAFTWDDKYLLGHDDIDRQHRELFEILNALHAAMKAGQGGVAIDSALAELFDYAQRHFSDEEAVMAAKGYPELDEHRRLHRQLMQKVTEMLQSRQAGEKLATFEVLGFVGEWIAEHVGRVDHQFGRFLHRAAAPVQLPRAEAP